MSIGEDSGVQGSLRTVDWDVQDNLDIRSCYRMTAYMKVREEDKALTTYILGRGLLSRLPRHAYLLMLGIVFSAVVAERIYVQSVITRVHDLTKNARVRIRRHALAARVATFPHQASALH